jgi:hypothetical protein
MVVVVVFIVLFAGNALSTINKTEITWAATMESSFEPTPSNWTFSKESKFMFGIGVAGFDLGDPATRFFDITMNEEKV